METLPPLDFQSFLADLMRDYLDYLDHLGLSIVLPATNLRRIDRFLRQHHIREVSQIDPRLVMQLLDENQHRVRANTLRLYRETFSGLCRYLIRRGCLRHNPVEAVPRPRPQPYLPYVFSPQELRRLFNFLQAEVQAAAQAQTFYRALADYTLYHPRIITPFYAFYSLS